MNLRSFGFGLAVGVCTMIFNSCTMPITQQGPSGYCYSGLARMNWSSPSRKFVTTIALSAFPDNTIQFELLDLMGTSRCMGIIKGRSVRLAISGQCCMYRFRSLKSLTRRYLGVGFGGDVLCDLLKLSLASEFAELTDNGSRTVKLLEREWIRIQNREIIWASREYQSRLTIKWLRCSRRLRSDCSTIDFSNFDGRCALEDVLRVFQ